MLRILRVCRWLVARLPVWLGRWLACPRGRCSLLPGDARAARRDQ